MAVCFLAYQRFQNRTFKWKEAHARNKVELEQPLDPQPPSKKKQQVNVSTQKLHKSWWPLSLSQIEREGGGSVNVLCVTVSPLKGRTYQAHLKTVVTFPALDSRASRGAPIWMADGSGQEIGLGVSPRRTVCILKKATLNAWPPHCLPWQSHLTIFCTPRSCGGGAGGGDSFQPGEGGTTGPPNPLDARQAEKTRRLAKTLETLTNGFKDFFSFLNGKNVIKLLLKKKGGAPAACRIDIKISCNRQFSAHVWIQSVYIQGFIP